MLVKGKLTAQSHKFDCLEDERNTGFGKRKEGEALTMKHGCPGSERPSVEKRRTEKC